MTGRHDLLWATSECTRLRHCLTQHVLRLTQHMRASSRDGEGWSGKMLLPPGEFEYKYILDDIFWAHDETQVS